MWTKQRPTEPQPQSQSQPSDPIAATPLFQRSSEPGFDAARPSVPLSRSLASIGAGLEIKGRVTGEEDLRIDAKVEGPVVISGHRLIVGSSGQLNSEVTARELVVYGKVSGNVNAADRVEIKKDGTVIGDIQTTRISIEDGAIFKGRIEIGGPGPKPAGKPGNSAVLMGAGAA